MHPQTQMETGGVCDDGFRCYGPLLLFTWLPGRTFTNICASSTCPTRLCRPAIPDSWIHPNALPDIAGLSGPFTGLAVCCLERVSARGSLPGHSEPDGPDMTMERLAELLRCSQESGTSHDVPEILRSSRLSDL